VHLGLVDSGAEVSIDVPRSTQNHRWAVWLLAAVGCARAASLAFYPLTDLTEGRYANIARVMLESGDWITPQTSPGVPFWAKPPLFAWASAASMGLLGINELAARLPSLAFAVMTLIVIYFWGLGSATRSGVDRPRDAAVAAVLVASTCLGFFVAAGAVMTDPSLVLATTWALTSFWMVTIGHNSKPHWRFGFFAALGLGMLAKGPVAIVLVAVPIVAWCLVHRRWADLRSLPWLRGTVLAVALSAPWYVAAEIKTPGFLRYFILGENLQRFLVPGWKGDLYGFTHTAPHGIVWMYFAAATLPWILVAAPAAVIALLRRQAPWDASLSFLWLAVLTPLAFFSFSSHVIWTYALPSIPPFSVLFGLWLTASPSRHALLRGAAVVAGAASVALAGCVMVKSRNLADNYSTREIFHEWEAARVAVPGRLVFEQHRVAPSLLFYADGAVLGEVEEVDESATHYDVYSREQADYFASQPPDCADARVVVKRVGDYVLVRETNLPQYCDVE
jgi:4-amino-4-deoxy-L-arabinose transferase-like glycosyltransferase